MAGKITRAGNFKRQKISKGIPNNARNRRLSVWISPAANAEKKPKITNTQSARMDNKHRVRS